MKKSQKILILFNIMILICIAVAGCGKKNIETPKDVIEDAFENQQYTISFYTENLDTPIPEIKYSSKSMPKIPTPERVGYIFDGWYMDEKFSIPYSKDLLYLYMKDVTLYAKWNKEKFTQNGVYDIKLSAKMDEILKKGDLVDKYPVNDLIKNINYENSCIEKSEKGLQLKLQFTSTEIVPLGGQPVYKVSPSRIMGDNIYLVEQITPDNSNDKILFFNIDKLDLKDTIYLDVTTLSYADPQLSPIERNETIFSYRVALKIEKLIGFSESFVDLSTPLEKNSNYLVKTHYNSEMAEMFNSVYSYIQVDNKGNYTLIKPFMPYAGLMGAEAHEKYTDNYYSRAMSFSPLQLYYMAYPDKEYTRKEMEESSYIPEFLNGGHYGDYTVEFHADTGMYYMIYDLGKNLDCHIVVTGATTGFMEMTSAMGRYDIIMTLDIDHIIKIADLDFKPLEGEAYVYNEKVQYYPGSYHDLNERNLIKESIDKNGISTNLFNFYYSAKEQNAPLSERKIHSHKFVVTPDKITASRKTKDSRYQIANFDVTTSIYGYEEKEDGKLFGDSMSVNTFDGSGRRETIEILTGKMLNVGDNIRIDTLFLEKVNPTIKLNEVKAVIYNVNNDKVDYSSGKNIKDIKTDYNFEKNVAIEYNYKNVNDFCKTLVYLKKYVKPEYIDNHKENGYKQYNDIELTDLKYSWGNVSNRKFSGQYYVDVKGTTFDPIKVVVLNFDDGIYCCKYIDYTKNTFNMASVLMSVGYELNNEFRELEMVYLDYFAEQGDVYSIKDGEDIVFKGRILYDENGKRRPIYNYNNIAEEINDLSIINDLINKKYILSIGETNSELVLNSCEIYTKSGVQYLTSNFTENIHNLLTSSGYGLLSLDYNNGFDNYHRVISYSIKVDGENKFNLVNYDYMFTDFDYVINRPVVVLPDGVKADNLSISVQGSSYGNRYTLNNNNGQYTLRFLTPGIYSMNCIITLDYDTNGNRIFNGEKYKLTLSQTIEVLDSKKEVSITFITDEEHPFLDEIQTKKDVIDGKNVYCYTINQLITDSIVTLNQAEYFSSTTDELYAWSPRPWSEYTLVDANRMFGVRERIKFPITAFGNNNIKLYSVWDTGIEVVIDKNKEITNMDSIVDRNLKLDNESYKGYYIVKVPEEELFIPEGFYFTGWTVVETGVFYSKYSNNPILTRESITVKATFIKNILIRYDVKSSYGEGISSQNILENNILQKPDMKAKDGYKFVGWRLATKFDSRGRTTAVAKENFDFTKPITKDTINRQSGKVSMVVLVAVFENENGNEVWQ